MIQITSYDSFNYLRNHLITRFRSSFCTSLWFTLVLSFKLLLSEVSHLYRGSEYNTEIKSLLNYNKSESTLPSSPEINPVLLWVENRHPLYNDCKYPAQYKSIAHESAYVLYPLAVTKAGNHQKIQKWLDPLLKVLEVCPNSCKCKRCEEQCF